MPLSIGLCCRYGRELLRLRYWAYCIIVLFRYPSALAPPVPNPPPTVMMYNKILYDILLYIIIQVQYSPINKMAEKGSVQLAVREEEDYGGGGGEERGLAKTKEEWRWGGARRRSTEPYGRSTWLDSSMKLGT